MNKQWTKLLPVILISHWACKSNLWLFSHSYIFFPVSVLFGNNPQIEAALWATSSWLFWILFRASWVIPALSYSSFLQTLHWCGGASGSSNLLQPQGKTGKSIVCFTCSKCSKHCAKMTEAQVPKPLYSIVLFSLSCSWISIFRDSHSHYATSLALSCLAAPPLASSEVNLPLLKCPPSCTTVLCFHCITSLTGLATLAGTAAPYLHFWP